MRGLTSRSRQSLLCAATLLNQLDDEHVEDLRIVAREPVNHAEVRLVAAAVDDAPVGPVGAGEVDGPERLAVGVRSSKRGMGRFLSGAGRSKSCCCASMLATTLELPATTLAELVGHADAGFTLRTYARDGRDTATVTRDVLARAAGANVGA